MPQSLFTAQTPVTTDANDGAPGIITATTFEVSETGVVTHVRFFSSLTIGGTYTGALHQVTDDDDPGPGVGTLLGSGVAGVAPSSGAWNTIALSSPVAVSPGSLYRVALHNSDGRYVASANGFFGSGSLVNGSLTAPGDGSAIFGGALRNGTFEYTGSATAYPNGFFASAAYFVDVVFVPDSETADVDIEGAITAPAATLSSSIALTDLVSGSLTAPAATLSATLTEAAESSGALTAPAATLSATLSVAPAVSGALTAPAATMSGELESEGIAPPSGGSTSGGWGTLLGIVKAAKQDWSEQRDARPVACPNDGEPLQEVRGVLHCTYDGWTWRP